MSRPDLPWAGECRCGKVRIKVSAPPLLSMACHCTGCQKMTASAFSLSLAIPAEGFEVTEGEPVIGGLHGADRHYHCPFCMSWMFTRAAGLDWFVNVRTTMLEQPGAFPPFVETFTSEKLPWVTTPAAHSFPTFPEFDQYPDLTRDYMAQA